MTNILKYSQLARALDMHNASISMAIKNKKLINDAEKKTININLPVNKIWIDEQVAKGKSFDLNRIFDKPEKKPNKDTGTKKVSSKKEPVENKTLDDLRQLELKKKKAEIKRIESAAKLNELRIKKQEGELIPYSEAEFLLNYIVEKLRSTSLQEIDSISNIYKERFAISHDEYIEIKKDLTDIVNETFIESIKEMKIGVEGIQEKYQEVREVGQRK